MPSFPVLDPAKMLRVYYVHILPAASPPGRSHTKPRCYQPPTPPPPWVLQELPPSGDRPTQVSRLTVVSKQNKSLDDATQRPNRAGPQLEGGPASSGTGGLIGYVWVPSLGADADVSWIRPPCPTPGPRPVDNLGFLFESVTESLPRWPGCCKRPVVSWVCRTTVVSWAGRAACCG